MAKIPVKEAERTVRRRMYKAMQKSILKVLVEPITNSDQVYKDMELAGSVNDEAKPILIFVHRVSKEFEIVDHGSGLSNKEMREAFEYYGEEKFSHRPESRSLFGQGLSDVLFTRKYGGTVHSIKGGVYYRTDFKWRSKKIGGKLRREREIAISDKKIKANKELREKYHIPDGNGTCVNFRFTEAPIPTNESLIKGLCNIYMLRFINSNPKRDVRLIFLDKNGDVDNEEKITYTFPEGGELLDTLRESIRFEDFPPIEIEAEVYRFPEPLTQGEVRLEHRDGGLLVFDENENIIDLTLFKFDEDPHAKHLYGKLKLTGVTKIIRDKLNQEEPEEILTETRDGFNKSHPFYRQLKEVIDEWLTPIVMAEEEREGKSASKLSEQTQERHKKAFDILNDLYKKINEETIDLGGTGTKKERPENGLEFLISNARIVKDRRYTVSLRVDIRVIPEESEIRVSSNNPSIIVTPNIFTVGRPDEEDIFTIKVELIGTKIGENGIVEAKFDEIKSQLLLTVVRETYPQPENGLEFVPASYKSESGSHNAARLFVDVNKIPLHSTIQVESNTENIKLDKESFVISSDYTNVISSDYTNLDSIIKVSVGYRGHGDGQKGTITAKIGSFEAAANIKIGPIKHEGVSGVFKGWEYKPLVYQLQTFCNELTGYIEINANHPINQKYFGINKEEAEQKVEKYPYCQILLAELILNECLAAIYSTAYKNNEGMRRGDAFTDITRYIGEKKSEIGLEVYKWFVNDDAIAFIEKAVVNN